MSRREFRTFRHIEYYFSEFRTNADDELWGVQTINGLPQFVNYDGRINTFDELKEKINARLKRMGIDNIDNTDDELPKNVIVIFIDN